MIVHGQRIQTLEYIRMQICGDITSTSFNLNLSIPEEENWPQLEHDTTVDPDENNVEDCVSEGSAPAKKADHEGEAILLGANQDNLDTKVEEDNDKIRKKLKIAWKIALAFIPLLSGLIFSIIEPDSCTCLEENELGLKDAAINPQ